MNERYRSQINMPEIGLAGQEKLAEAKVLVIGAGGLGCPALLSLVGMGIGCIGIVDFDRVMLSNLNRQTLYAEKDIGKLKCEAAAEKLEERNSGCKILPYPQKLSEKNAREIISGFDLVLDCCDNY